MHVLDRLLLGSKLSSESKCVGLLIINVNWTQDPPPRRPTRNPTGPAAAAQPQPNAQQKYTHTYTYTNIDAYINTLFLHTKKHRYIHN